MTFPPFSQPVGLRGARFCSRFFGAAAALLLAFALGAGAPPARAADDGSVWSVTREWSLEEEEGYAEWVRTQVDADFFVRHRMPTDCADAPYLLRFIYARMRGLPQGAHSKEGHPFGNWSKSFSHLPRAEHWTEDARFRAALAHVRGFSLARCFPQDTYPIDVWPEAGMLRPGTVFVNSKHSGIVYAIEPASFFPIQCAYSTLPVKVRSLIMIKYEEELTYDDIGMGLVNFNWWRRDGDGFVLVPDEEMPGYSLEQYEHPERLALRIHKAYSILDDDKEKALDGIVESMRSELELRVGVVIEGYDAYRGVRDRSKDSRRYDDYSTPGRDARLMGKLKEMDQLVEQRIFTRDELIDRLSSETIDLKVVPEINFLEFRHAMLAGEVSPEPWDRPAERWGVGDWRLVWHRDFGRGAERLVAGANGEIVGLVDGQPAVAAAPDGAVTTDVDDIELAEPLDDPAPLRRRFRLGDRSPDPLELPGGGAVVAYASGELKAFPAEGDEPLWTRDFDAHLYAKPIQGANGTVYVPLEDGRFFAVDPATGEALWSLTLGDRLIYPAVEGPNGAIYVTGTGSVYAMTPEGNLKWSRALPDAVYCPPAVGPDGSVYVGSLDRRLHAFLPDGSERWAFPARQSVLTPPLVSPDGERVYALSVAGVLFCVSHR